MRLVGLVVSAALAVSVVAEGAYIVRTRHQLETLSQRLESLRADRDDGALAPARAETGTNTDDDAQAVGRALARKLPPPRLVGTGSAPAAASDDPLPLPATLSSPESREQLRKFVLAALENERQEQRARMDQRREERDMERRQRMVKDLGLSSSESEKFNKLLTDQQTARDQLRSKLQSGELQGDAARQQMMALRTQNEQDMRGLLGDDRMKQYQDMAGPGPGQGRGGGGPGAFWGGGGRGRGGGDQGQATAAAP